MLLGGAAGAVALPGAVSAVRAAWRALHRACRAEGASRAAVRSTAPGPF